MVDGKGEQFPNIPDETGKDVSEQPTMVTHAAPKAHELFDRDGHFVRNVDPRTGQPVDQTNTTVIPAQGRPQPLSKRMEYVAQSPHNVSTEPEMPVVQPQDTRPVKAVPPQNPQGTNGSQK